MVYLDPVLMKENYSLHMSANDTIMISKPVRIEDILRDTMLGKTAYTPYSRPSARELIDVTQTHCKCSICNFSYPGGTSWCYDSCWMPTTWAGVRERMQHLSLWDNPQARSQELMGMYNITGIAFPKELDRPGSSVRSLPRGTYTISGV